MKLIQPILAATLLGIFVSYLSFFRSSLLDRLIFLVLFLLTFVAISLPEVTNIAANILGVGRGADLCFYIFSMGASFGIVLLYSKISRLERHNTKLVRTIAILTAEMPAGNNMQGDGLKNKGSEIA